MRLQGIYRGQGKPSNGMYKQTHSQEIKKHWNINNKTEVLVFLLKTWDSSYTAGLIVYIGLLVQVVNIRCVIKSKIKLASFYGKKSLLHNYLT